MRFFLSLLFLGMIAVPALTFAQQQPNRPLPREAVEALERATERPPPTPRPAPVPTPNPLNFNSPLDVPLMNTPGTVPIVPIRPNAAIPPTTTAPPPPTQQAEENPCGSGRDLNELLSPRCLESLRVNRNNPPLSGGLLAPSAGMPQFISTGVTCSVSVVSGQPININAMTSFSVPDVRACVQVGMRLSFGVVGMTNIVMVTPQFGVVGVVCFRTADNPQISRCHQQPAQE
jgi:hypothetical protein